MDYCARESTLNAYESEAKSCEGEAKATIKLDIQETYKILCETNQVLQDFAQIINGQNNEVKERKDASCLWEEARLMTAMAYENLVRLQEIKGSII